MRTLLSLLCFVSLSTLAFADGARGVVTDELTKKECSACHMAFPPGFLPARSWEALMGNLKEHFGEDASLAPEATTAIKDYLLANAADANGKARGFARGIPADQTPLRITELPRFKGEHGRFSDATMKKVGTLSNCAGCHQGAEKGIFEDD
jgi:hypothetical protein